MLLSVDQIYSFRKTIYDYYRSHGRDMPWRRTHDPYHILVSEIMLQQTQVERVSGKYEAFINLFPDFASLATASLDQVLRAWSGLGYNRRALALVRIAECIMSEFSGTLPHERDALATLPGIGKATSGAIIAFAFQVPVVFVETNIRRVFIHYFFPSSEDVSDSQLLPLVEETLDRSDPRHWYYALMDYGVMLKKKEVNPNRRSAHYRKQPAFENSKRQVRGALLRILVEQGTASLQELAGRTEKTPHYVDAVLRELEAEGFVKEREGIYAVS